MKFHMKFHIKFHIKLPWPMKFHMKLPGEVCAVTEKDHNFVGGIFRKCLDCGAEEPPESHRYPRTLDEQARLVEERKELTFS